jgi:hypothetical protein
MPMLKKYPEIAQNQELKMEPKLSNLNAILNYSKSLEVKTIKKKKILLVLN